MIGQYKIQDWIKNINVDKMPHFIILVGSKGSGKKQIAKTISAKINAPLTIVGTKVDEVRQVIDTAYTVRDKVVYCFADADTMRAEAKNAMLKITEEPPKNAYFVLTVQDDSTLLATIKSRATVFELEPYTQKQLDEYCVSNNLSIIYNDIAKTPYECSLMNVYGQEFIDFVELVVDNIATVEPANAFKSSGKLSFKEDGDKYDLKLFWEVFIKICMDRLSEDPLRYAQGVCETVPYSLKVTRLGVNKQQLFDSWVFKIREVWL